MALKYRYAADRTGHTADILTLDEAGREEGRPFTCLSCDAEMVARLGQRRTKHFAHHPGAGGACSPESYLHKLGKQVFLETYRRCLESGEPYTLHLESQTTCTHLEQITGHACTGARYVPYDLTQLYPEASLEGEIDGFRADVLLTGPQARPLLIEIAVTHGCEPAKIDSGLPIIEFRLREESDVERLCKTEITIPGMHAAYNFHPRPHQGDLCQGDCMTLFDIFIVHRTGECQLRKMTGRTFTAGIPGDPLHVACVGSALPDEHHGVWEGEYLSVSELNAGELSPREVRYREEVRKARYRLNLPLKDCTVCRYHGGSHTRGEIFCKMLRVSVAPNNGAHCQSFSPLGNLEACRQADIANTRYLRKRTVGQAIELMLGGRK
ncbi:MAG: competence protein CoiA family protein [Gammaproteobacteria bacterium]